MKYNKASFGLVQEDGSVKELGTSIVASGFTGLSDDTTKIYGFPLKKEENSSPQKAVYKASFSSDGTLILDLDAIEQIAVSLLETALNEHPTLFLYPFTVTHTSGPVLDATEEIPYDHNETTVTLKFDLDDE